MNHIRHCCNITFGSRVYASVSNRARLASAAATVILVAVACAGVSARGGQDSDDDAVKLASDLIAVDLTVTDAKGNYVTDLRQSDFKLFEDGRERSIDFFGQSGQLETSRPLAVVIALDISGSITRSEIALQREAALKFVTLVRPESQFAVISFNHQVNVLQKFTSNPHDVGKAFDKIRDVGGSTRLFDTLDQATTMLSRTPQTRGGRRMKRVIVVITDGYDSSSTIAPLELIRRAQDAGVTIYSITLPSFASMPGSRQERIMTILDAHGVVPATGGQDFEADIKDFAPVFRAIAEEIASGYQVAFYPPDSSRQDGKVHQLRVEVVRPGAIVRANRTGYQVSAAAPK